MTQGHNFVCFFSYFSSWSACLCSCGCAGSESQPVGRKKGTTVDSLVLQKTDQGTWLLNPTAGGSSLSPTRHNGRKPELFVVSCYI